MGIILHNSICKTSYIEVIYKNFYSIKFIFTRCHTIRNRIPKYWVLMWNTQCDIAVTIQIHNKNTTRICVHYMFCSSIASTTNITKLQNKQNTALRIATGCTLNTSIHHLHNETKTYYYYTHTWNVTHHKSDKITSHTTTHFFFCY